MTLVPANEQAEILLALGLNPRDPKVQALALVAQRYNLDLILKHVFLIQGTVYVSHAGLLHLAHTSGDLDGIEVEATEDDKKWVATAKIYRKSMSRPFTYTDECYKNEQKVTDKRKRAITRAERNALRRAFDVACDVWEDDRPEPPIVLSDERPEVPRRPATSAGALPAGEGPHAPSLEASREPVSPEPSPAGPTVDPAKSVVIRCREMGLDDDDRHALVAWVTKGRTESSTKLEPKEAGQVHATLHHLAKYGEKLWSTSRLPTSTSPSPPSTPSPAETSTSSPGPPSGDAA